MSENIGYKNPVVEVLRDIQETLKKQTVILHEIQQGRARAASSWLNVKQAADYLGKNPKTIRRWIKSGKLAALKLHSGGDHDRYLISESAVEELFRQAKSI